MEKPIDQATAVNTRFVKVTPEQLRQFAARLDLAARENTLPGEMISCPFTRSITLLFDPEIQVNRFKTSMIELEEAQDHAEVLQ